MDYTVIIILQIVNLIFLGFALFFKSYLGEKGKNAASKDDVQHLTELVEGVSLFTLPKLSALNHRCKTSFRSLNAVVEFTKKYVTLCGYL
jgi:hypothetical protein